MSDHPLLHMLTLGRHRLPNRLFVAPMAGVTDRPFRQLCRRLGAGHAVSEMVTSRPELRDSLKTSRRTDHAGEPGPIAVQIAGTDAAMMAEAAAYNIARGAQIIDINMGCPAKKVCNVLAGSALMRDEPLARAIIAAVVQAAAPHGVPVTLKMRTGWCAASRNAVALARAAEDLGVAMVTVHGRTREQGYSGQAEYDTVAAVKAALRIPVVVNGDIGSPAQALAAWRATGADAVMIGRAAQGRPWLFGQIAHTLATGQPAPAPRVAAVAAWLDEHLQDHHHFYGGPQRDPQGLLAGVRTARKHIGWVLQGLPGGAALRRQINALDDAQAQRAAVAAYFAQLAALHERLPEAEDGADAAGPGPAANDARMRRQA